MYNTSGLQSERKLNKIYVCSLYGIVFFKPSCTSDQGSLKYALLLFTLLSIKCSSYGGFSSVTLWDYIYSDQSKLFTLHYLANTKPKKIKKYIFRHRSIYLSPGGALAYVTLTGTCGPIGYGFQGVLS